KQFLTFLSRICHMDVVLFGRIVRRIPPKCQLYMLFTGDVTNNSEKVSFSRPGQPPIDITKPRTGVIPHVWFRPEPVTQSNSEAIPTDHRSKSLREPESSAGSMQGPRISGDLVRCPYCVLGYDFRPMVLRPEGWFICEKCGHVRSLERTGLKCSCRK